MTPTNGSLRTITLLLLLMAGLGVHAQAPTSFRAGLRVQALTSEERDALNRQLRTEGGMRVAYACVPAGIIILEHDATTRSAAEMRDLLLARAAVVLPASRIMEEDIEQQDAERRCATARGQ